MLGMDDTGWLVKDMINDVRPDLTDISKYDTNGDGFLDVSDCPFEPGSTKAQLWFTTVLKPYIQMQTQEVSSKFDDGTQVVGVYKGKALVPGDRDDGGDLTYVVDRLILTKGMSPAQAQNIALVIKNPIYMVDIPK